MWTKGYKFKTSTVKKRTYPDKIMVIKSGFNHSSYKDVSPVTHSDLFMFTVLTSSNECMAYLTLVPLL